MKAKFIAAAVALLLAGLLLYLQTAGTGSPRSASRERSPDGATSAETSGLHQGHAPEQPKAHPEAPPPQDTAPPTIEIAPEKQQLIGVRTLKVAARPLSRTIRTVGRIEYDEKKLATVNTKVDGWIEKLFVNYTGRHVQRGEPLAEIYSPELLATQKEFLNLLRWTKSATGGASAELERMLAADAAAILDAARERLRLWDITDEEIRRIEETGRPVRTLTIYSPVTGYVVQKTALQGMRVAPGEKLFDVADLSTLWIVADIYEYELPLVTVGQAARIRLSYFPGKEFPSRIEYIYPALSPDTRTAKVRFTIPNPSGQVKPQMFTDVELEIGLGKRLAVPEDAVIDTGERQIVYVHRGEGYFEPREVSLGLKADGLVEVTRGLKAGEEVASSASFLIDSEAKLKGVVPLSQ